MAGIHQRLLKLRCLLLLLCLLQADLSSNMFDGPIPAVLSQSSQLVYLNVSNNQLSGIESADAWSTPALMTLDASYNQISGGLVTGQGFVCGGVPGCRVWARLRLAAGAPVAAMHSVRGRTNAKRAANRSSRQV